MSEEFKDEGILRNLIIGKYATLKELETYYDLDDAIFLTACLEVESESGL